MATLRDIAHRYYLDHNCNCAESVINAAKDYFGIPFDEAAVHAFGVFGGGMCCGETCGALAGSMGAIGALCIKTKAHDSGEYRVPAKGMMDGFYKEFGSYRCADLKPRFFVEHDRCFHVVGAACDILEGLFPPKES